MARTGEAPSVTLSSTIDPPGASVRQCAGITQCARPARDPQPASNLLVHFDVVSSRDRQLARVIVPDEHGVFFVHLQHDERHPALPPLGPAAPDPFRVSGVPSDDITDSPTLP